MGEFASKGVAGSGLGLGIAGTALGLLNANGNGGGLLGGLLGGGCQNAQLGQALNALAEKDAKIAELTAMRYSDNQDAAASAALEKAGGKVELSGYIMDKADIDALLEIAKKFAVD